MTYLATTRRLAFFLAFNVLVVNTLCWLAMRITIRDFGVSARVSR